MSVFSEAALGIIAQYRQMLRRAISNKQQREEKLTELGLAYQYSKDTDYQLYHKINLIIEDLKSYCDSNDNNNYYHYSGAKKFHNYLELFIKQYLIQDQTVIHCTQLASKRMLEVIQIATLPTEKLCSDEIIKRLAAANHSIALYGVPEQHEQHLANLRSYRHEANAAFYDGMINNFNKALIKTDSAHTAQNDAEEKLEPTKQIHDPQEESA